MKITDTILYRLAYSDCDAHELARECGCSAQVMNATTQHLHGLGALECRRRGTWVAPAVWALGTAAPAWALSLRSLLHERAVLVSGYRREAYEPR